MNYISNNQEIIDAIIDFYQYKKSALEVADIYFKYNLYSAAATYYNIHLQSIRNNDNILKYNEVKSYCFSQMAASYYYQELDHNYSIWQLEMIQDLCKESIIYNPQNVQTHFILGQVYFFLRRDKDAYYSYKSMVMSLDYNKILSPRLYEDIFNAILLMFELCKNNQIIITNNVIKKIYDFLINSKYYTFDNISLITQKVKEHLTKEEIEINIMNGNF